MQLHFFFFSGENLESLCCNFSQELIINFAYPFAYFDGEKGTEHCLLKPLGISHDSTPTPSPFPRKILLTTSFSPVWSMNFVGPICEVDCGMRVTAVETHEPMVVGVADYTKIVTDAQLQSFLCC